MDSDLYNFTFLKKGRLKNLYGLYIQITKKDHCTTNVTNYSNKKKYLCYLHVH